RRSSDLNLGSIALHATTTLSSRTHCERWVRRWAVLHPLRWLFCFLHVRKLNPGSRRLGTRQCSRLVIGITAHCGIRRRGDAVILRRTIRPQTFPPAGRITTVTSSRPARFSSVDRFHTHAVGRYQRKYSRIRTLCPVCNCLSHRCHQWDVYPAW